MITCIYIYTYIYIYIYIYITVYILLQMRWDELDGCFSFFSIKEKKTLIKKPKPLKRDR